MAEEGERESGGGGLKASLTHKLGPLPVWVWAIAAAGVGYYLLRRFGGGGSATTTTQQPATASQGQPADLQQIPIYLGPTTSSDLPAGTTTATGQTGNPETNTFAQNSATGLVPQAAGQNVPDVGGRQVLQYTSVNGITALPIGGELVAMSYANPVGPYQQASNARLAALVQGLGTPSTLPVGDLYGGIGYLNPQTGAAGGYWGQNGQWVATPTPWNPLPGQPPLGNLQPGTPYITGNAPGLTALSPSGPVVGTPTSYVGNPSAGAGGAAASLSGAGVTP